MAETEETGAVSVEDIVLYERVFVSGEDIRSRAIGEFEYYNVRVRFVLGFD